MWISTTSKWPKEELNQTGLDLENLKNWVNFYSRRLWINFLIDENLPAPAAIPDNSTKTDLTIMLNPKLLVQKFGFKSEELLFIMFHEIEHLIEGSKMKSTDVWKKIAEERERRFKEAKHFAWAIHTLENAVRDVYVNNQGVSKAPVLSKTRKELYENHLFKRPDFLKTPEFWKDWKETWKFSPLPKHLQFAYTILREAMLPEEKCNIDPDIRRKINSFKRIWVIEDCVNWDLSNRLNNIWDYLEPTYKKLLEEDIKNKNTPEKPNNKKWDQWNDEDNWNSSNNSNQNGDWKQDESNDGNQDSSWGNGQDLDREIQNDLWKGEEGLDKENQNGDWKQDESETQNQGSPWRNGEKTTENEPVETNSNSPEDKGDENNWAKNPFEDLYENFWNLPHILDEALSKDDMEKVKSEIDKKVNSSKPKSREQLELENRAENMWISRDNQEFEDIVDKLREYDRFLEQLKSVKDSETWNSVMEEICSLFENIRASRLKPKMKSKWPVDMEHWVRLDGWSVATWIAEIKSGNFNPLMFAKNVTHLKENLLVWDFDLTIIADWTWSMQWEKNRQQKIAFLLILEALKMLHDKIEINKSYLKKPINFQTTWFIFGRHSRCIKEKSSDIKDKERLQLYSSLDEYDWPKNNEWLLLEKIYKDFHYNTSESEKKEIKDWKTKKIIIVLSDWWQDVPEYERKLRENISNFRNDWVLVYAVGITNDWSPVVDLFSWENKSLWFWQVCEDVWDLAKTIKDLLVDHIKEI